MNEFARNPGFCQDRDDLENPISTIVFQWQRDRLILLNRGVPPRQLETLRLQDRLRSRRFGPRGATRRQQRERKEPPPSGPFRSAIGLRAVTLGRQIFSRELMRQRRPLQARGMRTVDRIVDEPIEGVSVSDAGSLLSVCKTAFPNLQSKQQTRCLALLPTPRLGSLP